MAGGLGVLGLAFMAIGLFAPHVAAFALSAGRCAARAAARMRRRMRHNSRSARPACFGAEDAKRVS